MTKSYCDKCGAQGGDNVIKVWMSMCGPGPHIERDWCDDCLREAMHLFNATTPILKKKELTHG